MENFKEKTIETYNKIAPSFSKANFDHFWIDELEQFKKLINGKKVIDIGCGAGRDASAFLTEGFDYIGVDASEKMLEVARNRVPRGRFKQMDFFNLKFPDNTFDGFWAAASFLHIPKNEIKRALQEAKRVTRFSGAGFVSVKEKTTIDEGMVNENKHGGISRYFSFYTQPELKKILEEEGFTLLETITHQESDSPTNWLCFFVRK